MIMKKIFGLILAMMLFASCQEVAEFKDVIYFTGTEESPRITFTIEEPRDMGVTITATNKVATDTRVLLEVGDQSMLDAYNA